MKRKYMIIVLMAGALELTGCSQGTSNSAKNGTTGSENTIISESDIAILDTEDMFTERDRDTEYDESECTAISLSDEETKCDSDGVKMDGQTVTITEGGTYLLTGSLSNGSVVVDTDKTEKVQLILENVSIINEEGAGICVEQADKVFITLADGSTNKIVSNSFTGNEDTNIDGAIFSREDLTLNGSGTLKITSAAHGIVSKDDLVLTGGVYQIQSEKQGLSGKESVRIADGTFTITSGTDAIHSEDTDEDAKGDGIDSNGDFSVSGGVIYVSGPGDDGNGALDYDGTATITGGTVVAAGMSGMAQNFGSDSTQGTMLINLDTDQSGEITLKDTDGTVLVSYTPVRDFNSVVISCEELEEGAAYTLTTGLESEKITMSSLVYSEGQSMQGPGQGGPRMDGQNGQP